MGILPGPSARFEAFVAPARPRPALWRLILGAALAAAVWLAALVGLLWLAFWLERQGGGAPGAGPLVIAFLASFGALILGLHLALRLLHGRGAASLLGPRGFVPRHFLAGVLVVAGFGAMSALPSLGAAPPVRQTDLARWLAWLPLALPALLVQIAAEEMAFRGYLMQGLAARFRAAWVWWLLPAAVFGLMHWNPAEFGPNAWLVVATATLTGLILGDVTARTGNLSAAMGLHFANNAVALLVVAVPSPLGGLSLWVADLDGSDAAAVRSALVANLAATALAYAATLAILARRRRAR